MNYEEKYKQALSRAIFYNGEWPTKEQRKMLEVIFPELAADNEDERIRNKLICFVENWKNFNPNSPFDDYAVYTSDRDECDKILAWLEKQGVQPTDKVEPKFKVGNWVVFPLGIIAHIDSLNSTDYQVTTTDGKICDFKISKQNNYHLWTITDAKAGDVLASKDGDDILIFRNIDTSVSFSSYYNIVRKGESNWDNTRFFPATKEQRNLLFQKIAEAGYEWDAEKKELKKVESKKLDADKVIAWLNDQACQGWIEDVEVDKFIQQFKEDFKL